MRASFQMRAVFLAAALAAPIVMPGCASVDKALFGGTGQPAAEPSTTPAPESSDADADQTDGASPASAQTATVPPTPGDVAAGPIPGTLPSPSEAASAPLPPPPPSATPVAGTMASAPGPSGSQATIVERTSPPAAPPQPAPASAAASGPAISPVAIAPGPDTGTAVAHTIAGLRASLQEISTRLSSLGQQYANLHGSSAQQVGIYYQAQAQISARLQGGTTKGNPELVAQWNTAQSALDQVTSNVNALGALAAQADADGAHTRTLLGQIQGSLNPPGATDEDHRQLGVLEDEANQTVVVLDRLSRDISADVRRYAATLNAERPRLAQLANAIRAGDLYASNAVQAGAAPGVGAAGPVVSAAGATGAIVTIRFGRRAAPYQKSLYTALSEALERQPAASFQVVGVSPARASVAAVQAAQADARRRAQEVIRTMGQMGVPPARMEAAAATDPAISGSEVRVFVR